MLSLFQMGLYYTSGLSVLSSLMGFSYCGCYYFFSSLIFIATADCGLCPSVILAQQMAQNVPGIFPSTRQFRQMGGNSGTHKEVIRHHVLMPDIFLKKKKS